MRTEPLRITLRPWGKRKVDLVGDESHPLWPDTIHNFSMHGQIFPTLVDVMEYAAIQRDMHNIVSQAMQKLQPYEPKCELVFIATPEMNRREKINVVYWTSGTNSRTSLLLPSAILPGSNLLAEIFSSL